MSASEFTVHCRHGQTQQVISMTCEKCGDMRVLFPTALLVLLMGRGHLPCPKCRGVSATSVAGQVQIEGYDEDEDDDECAD